MKSKTLSLAYIDQSEMYANKQVKKQYLKNLHADIEWIYIYDIWCMHLIWH